MKGELYMLNIIKKNANKFKTKAMYILACTQLMVISAYASNNGAAKADIDIEKIMVDFFSWVVNVPFFWAGLGLLIYGGYQFVMAFRNEDSDSKTRAINAIIAGVGVMGLKAVINKIMNGRITLT
jgi:hypothetical protein